MVPFERLGPGQVGRLVYQVMGKNGPIFNPTNISFLPPPEHTVGTATLPELALGLSGLNLSLTAVNTAVSLKTLSEVRRLHAKFEEMLGVATSIEMKVDEISVRLKRIDIRVAEAHLREAVRYIFERAVRPDQIELKKLPDLLRDISNFQESVEGGLMFNRGIKLSSDVRERLADLLALLTDLRVVVAIRHNAASQSRPRQAVVVEPMREFFEVYDLEASVRAAALLCHVSKAVEKTKEVVLESVDERFTFSDEKDATHFAELLDANLAGPVSDTFGEAFPMSHLIIQAFESEEPLELVDRIRRYEEQVVSWFQQSDAALLLRLELELEALQKGYEHVFWVDLANEPGVDLDDIWVDTRLEPLQL